MPFLLIVPEPSGTPLSIPIDVGQCVFVLGANGTGKSSLMHRFYTAHHGNARRISAHRQTWFASNAVTLSPEQKRNAESNIQSTDTDAQSRWKDDYAAQRANIAIYDLIDAENVRARSIARAVDDGAIDLARDLSKKDAPIKIINELLRLSNIPIEVSVRQNEQVLASKSGSPPYSIAELSEGERNALLIAANVLTVPAGTLLLVDEPERHLHRSIISPLLTLLFSKRTDCGFVVSTHDVMLPLDNPMARTLLVRSCTYSGSSVTSWDADLVPSETNIDEALKKDILGSRRKLIFVEGDEGSLDKPLYSLLFPGLSIVAKSSCRDVEHGVTGIRGATDMHWLNAFGIVDSDRRTPEDVARLRAKGIHSLSVYSVESLYYHPEIQRRVVSRHAAVTGDDIEDRLQAANAAALDAIRPHVQRMSERAVEKTLRDVLDKHWPKQSDIAAGRPISITIDVAATVAAESGELNTAINDGNIERIVCRYPVRETPLLTEVARKLGFQNREQYENAVRKLLMDDSNALAFVKAYFGTLDTEISLL